MDFDDLDDLLSSPFFSFFSFFFFIFFFIFFSLSWASGRGLPCISASKELPCLELIAFNALLYLMFSST